MFRKNQVLLSITIASLVMVLVIGVTATLPAYSQNSASEMSKSSISLHCNFKDIDVVNGARGSVTFATADKEIKLGLFCASDNSNRNKAMKTFLLPSYEEVISVETTTELLNNGAIIHQCDDSSSGKHIVLKCRLPDNNKNFVMLSVNFVK